jgi:protein-S-isoprenylcysteine O-methyltransferase Ste14
VLPEDIVTAFLTLSLALVLVRAAYEHRKFHRGKKETASEEAESTANEPLIILSAVFVVIFYLEMASYVILVVAGFQHVLVASYVQLQVPFASPIQALGVAIMLYGYVIIFLGLRALERDKLVTRGPYRYVRHPQYLGYFIVFAGFFLLLQNLVALVPLLSIPGEVRMATIEEGFLTEKFGNSYADYQKVTGKFLPKIRTKKSHDRELSHISSE